MTRAIRVVAAAGLVLLVAACAGAAPETPAQRLLAAELTFTAVVEGLISARDAGLIERGSATEASVGAGIETARQSLDAAQAAIVAGSPESVSAWLDVAHAALEELQRILIAAQAREQVSVLPGFGDGPRAAAQGTPRATPRAGLVGGCGPTAVPGYSLFADAGVAL